MIDIPRATAPENNVVVHAAAGTGKTWLLTSRIIRLLLTGSEPGAILAITFTRKAAGEIHQRITERLFALAGSDARMPSGSYSTGRRQPSDPSGHMCLVPKTVRSR